MVYWEHFGITSWSLARWAVRHPSLGPRGLWIGCRGAQGHFGLSKGCLDRAILRTGKGENPNEEMDGSFGPVELCWSFRTPIKAVWRRLCLKDYTKAVSRGPFYVRTGRFAQRNFGQRELAGAAGGGLSDEICAAEHPGPKSRVLLSS